MSEKSCSHPNCRLVATKSHPRKKDSGGLCDAHYSEILSSLKQFPIVITLTCPSDSK